MSTATLSPTPAPAVGPTVELARYRISAGERIRLGQRVDGNARLLDKPADGDGRSFLVEPHLEDDNRASLQALIDDYIGQAHRHDQVPMLRSPLENP